MRTTGQQPFSGPTRSATPHAYVPPAPPASQEAQEAAEQGSGDQDPQDGTAALEAAQGPGSGDLTVDPDSPIPGTAEQRPDNPEPGEQIQPALDADGQPIPPVVEAPPAEPTTE